MILSMENLFMEQEKRMLQKNNGCYQGIKK
jgi:hypothetical protein